jgi:oxygen-independent coproporphyrinogen-3 oxidase
MIQTLPDVSLSEEARELRSRMQKPQRHRLLHGYPLAAAMQTRKQPWHPMSSFFESDPARGLLVGVLPHPFCNPAVTGCGFCTFPHEKFSTPQATAVVGGVIDEIDQRLSREPTLQGRAIAGLYFGGGTANLTPPESFRALCRRLAQAFDFSQAEVTLEGVPIYFLNRRPLLVDILREQLPARHFRLSMGIQTFNEEQLRRMGRLAFGLAGTFREVVELAHARGFTISADLLFNLPGQSRDQMRDDVRQAIDLGLDHLGLYHLVLFRGLGTEWARDKQMLASLPSSEAAADNWLALREDLLSQGFYQATLTNFERLAFRGDARRFQYEEQSFRPDRFDMVGFGPSAISFTAEAGFLFAEKLVNPDAPSAYLGEVARKSPAWDRFHLYDVDDLQVFYLTRRLAALSIDRDEYRRLFEVDPLRRFAREFDALLDEKLIEVTPAAIVPTPCGMFYADSIASLLAWRQVRALRGASSRRLDLLNDNSRGFM